MEYFSTRGSGDRISASEAIAQGLAPDGGLFVPAQLPPVTEEALRELLPRLDLSQPVWLPRHRADWEEYALTRFLPEHFMEAVPFDFMEISYIFPEDEKKAARPRDPRWDA